MKFGLSQVVLERVIPEDDDIAKARAGFTRGGAHKYIRRVRAMGPGGKLRWKYYYADDQTRSAGKRYVADRAKARRGRAKQEDEDAEHGLISELEYDHPELVTSRTPLGKLTVENVTDDLPWSDHLKPEVRWSEREEVEGQYHRQLTDDAEPQDFHGQAMSPLRALEMSFDRLPPRIKEHFGGFLSEVVLDETEDDPDYMRYYKKRGGAAGLCKTDRKNSSIHIALNQSFRVFSNRPRMGGGMLGMEVILHEMGHAVHNYMGATTDVPMVGKGPFWEDYLAFYKKEGKAEPGVTKNAEKNAKERFADSFTCALMYPQQLATTAPKMYEFMRTLLGEDALPPLNTDKALKTKLEDQLAAEKAKEAQRIKVRLANKKAERAGKKPRPLPAGADPEKVKQLTKQLRDVVGIMDIPPKDPRVAWWAAPKPTKVQTILNDVPPPNYASDAIMGTFDPKDKFYEMNVGGRSIMMRIGPSGGKDPEWTPTGVKGRLLASNIKEVYDADGNPLDRITAWWYLHQDAIGNRTSIPPEELIGRKDKPLDVSALVSLSDDPTEANQALRNTFNLHEVLGKIARDKNPKLSARPVEVSAQDFAARSGAFAYSNWSGPGDDLIAEGSKWRAKLDDLEPGTAAYNAHWDQYRKHQPHVAFEELVATAWHVKHGLAKREGQVLGRRYLTDNGVPRLTGKRYANANPDGSSTIIETTAGPDGRFYLASPIWRELLTPNGGDIKSASDLMSLCQQATEAALGQPAQPRRAWVSVRADYRGKRGASEHYMHMQVEFDGRGQPKILGEEWQHMLGVKDPRLDDLLTSGKPGERGPAKIMGEKIKKGKPPSKRRGRELLPTKQGQRAILKVTTDELGLKTKGADREVVVRVARIIPGSKAGEAPSPPGWDRMPEGFDEPYPAGSIDPVDRLTDQEFAFVEEGLLPPDYGGRLAEREWLKRTFIPAHKKWQRTIKAETRKERPPKYMFVGEPKGGAPRKVIWRTGEADTIATISYPPEPAAPEPLMKTPLMYQHQEVDPVTGEVDATELRLLLPQDGHIDVDMIDNLPGVNVMRGTPLSPRVPGPVTGIAVDMSAVHRLREALGGLSLTEDAEAAIKKVAEQVREQAELAAEGEHVMSLDEIDPLSLALRGVGLRGHLSDGTRFRLAQHQKELVQKLIDNGGRVLGGHFMGTGKTVSAIVAAKLMMARSNPDSPMYDPAAPKKTLVVAPLNVVEQWRQAAVEFDEGATVVGAKSSDIPAKKYLEMVKAGTEQNDLVIVGPEYFTQHQKELKEAGFDALVVDEAHMGIKNAKTKRNKAMSAWNEDMKMMMLLTGTPITTSPSDILEYIKILSKGQQWAGKTRADLENEFLEESPVPGEAGVKGKKGPKVQIKASKRDELAAILAKWVHVAMAKDVRGKTLPAVRMEESKFAEMVGIQAQLYALQLAALPEAQRESMKGNAALAADEMTGLDGEGRRRVQAAKAIANCPAYKPASTDKVLMMQTTTYDPKTGEIKDTEKTPFRTFGIGYLKTRSDIRSTKLRNQAKNRWPTLDEMTAEQVAIYNTMFRHVIDPENKGLTYEQIAGQKISRAQWKAMEKRHVVGDQVFEPWGDGDGKFSGPQLQNPDWGPLGIRFRGVSRKRTMTAEEMALVDEAEAFQRAFQSLLTTPDAKGKVPLREEAWLQVKSQFGLDEAEAHRLMGVPPEMYSYSASVSHGGVTVTTDDEWVSDTRGSLHLLYRKEDWDAEAGRPRSAGGFEKVRHMEQVDVDGKYKWLKKPKDADDDWTPPVVRYREDLGEKTGQRVAVEIMSGTEKGVDPIKWVRKSELSARVKSLMDPGMRKERAKADLAMVPGNAKAEELMAYIENFHIHTGNGNFAGGEDRSRSMVIFANSILDGCRTVEAALRVQGFRDVNEVLAGSPHHDPDDDGPAPNGKYFVTYIGGTYTGDRELNIEISKKVKDKLGRDTETSLFVHKCQEGRKWNLYPGGPEHPSIKMSQWTQEQRERIHNQFKIRAPEAHFTDDKGRTRYFYGTTDTINIPGETDARGKPLKVKGSAGLLREMTLTGDPSKLPPGAERGVAIARLQKLQAMYEELVRAGTSDAAVKADPTIETGPMKVKNKKGKVVLTRAATVMNNTEVMVLSDAAQVGINKGDAVELVMYDSLASPMAEMQRITRSARMLPPAVRDAMLNKYITKVSGLRGGDFKYAQLSDDPDMPTYVEGAKRIDHLWQAIKRTKKRPEGMSWVEYKDRAKLNGATPLNEEQYERMATMDENQLRDASRVTWEVKGKVAVAYHPPGSDPGAPPEIAYVDRSAITETDGPFRRIKAKMEAGAFDPAPASRVVPGQVVKAQMLGIGIREDITFNDALRQIAKVAEEAAERATARKAKAHVEAWNAIAARARAASTLGVVQAAAALQEFKQTKIPGEPGNVIAYQALDYQEPTEGTYGLRTAAERAAGMPPSAMEEEIEEPVNAIRQVLESELSEPELSLIAKAGFVEQGQSSSLDATEIYLAIRAQEIMATIDRRRPEVGRRMRSETGGKVVTDADIMNTIIDELSPMDRAILKSKKYLVNVRRIGASGYVPAMVPVRERMLDEDGNPVLDKKGRPRSRTVRVPIGYEKQHPIATERNTRAIGRARVIPVENLLHAIQQGVRIRGDLDFEETTSRDVANMSRLDPIVKSLHIGLPLTLFKVK